GVSNISFGLKPQLRRALNSVFLHECLDAGLDAAIIHAGKIVPLHDIDEDIRTACTDLVHNRRSDDYDPLEDLLNATTEQVDIVKADPLEGLSVNERLETRIVEGMGSGLEADLDEALGSTPAMNLINDVLLAGMKTVGELFASGDMQLPFVLRSAQTMKAAVAYLEPHLDTIDDAGRGSIVLATVSGDVHDIGKNLVDIILSNNGYTVHNLGIKVSIAEMIDRFEETSSDAIGMSGLLVKSTLIMRDNLDELARRDLGDVPVLLGGAALTRKYVEQDLRERYPGPLIYGKDAFAGLDAMAWITGDGPEPSAGTTRYPTIEETGVAIPTDVPSRSPDVSTADVIPEPPFYGSRIVKGIELDDIARYLNTTALLRNQWQYRPVDGEDDAAFKERLAPEMRRRIAQARAEDLLQPSVAYGYFHANSEGNDVVIWADESRTTELSRFPFPRQQEAPWLCIADFFRPVDEGLDVAGFHVVSMGAAVSERTAQLFAEDRYEDYLKLHGIGVEMVEALAEYWHARVRTELGIGADDDPTIRGLFRQRFQGGRYSWGYPACPDLEDNLTVAQLLDAERIGVEVGPHTGYQYQPEQTTSAIICHHPAAKYFIARSPKEQRDAQ
ncbi:MAG: vitamin B12 dependent-methionine synthase activation domain-containing protein, partial [Acidimicrobiia bacterium]